MCFLIERDEGSAKTTITDDPDSTLLASLSNGTGVPAQIRACNDTLISTGENGTLTFWKQSWLGEDRTVQAHASTIVALYMTASNVFTGGMDGLVKNWDLQSGHLIQEITTRYKDLRVIITGQQELVVLSTDDAHTALEASNKCPTLRAVQICLLPYILLKFFTLQIRPLEAILPAINQAT